jgi:pilus assembly protein FimV
VVNSPKKYRKNALLLAIGLALSPLWVSAAGLGRITVQSGLGQPLRAELEVTASRDEIPSLVAKLASADAFRIAGIDFQPGLSSIQFSKEVKERNGRRYIEVVSNQPINEPFVDMLVELSWASGRLVREYTFLLDPPELVKPVAAPTPSPMISPEVKTVERAPVMIPAMSAGRSVADAPALAVARPAAAVPAAPKPAVESSSIGQTREVVPGDTLGRIAAQTKPDGISLDQMLVALFRSNKDAFAADNMNRLKAGKILSIPTAEEARQVDKSEARREIVAQAADFNSYRNKLAALAQSAPAAQSNAGQASSGKIAPKVADSAPKTVAGDKLEVSKSEAAKDGNAKGAPLQGRLTAIEEDLIARDRALREANSRVGDLEKNLNDLKKLAELKSQAGAAVQNQADASKQGAAPAADNAPVPAQTAPSAATNPTPTNGGVLPAPTGEAGKSPVAVEAAKPPVAKPAAPVAAPPAEPGFMEEYDLPLKVGAVVALFGAYFGVMALRRRRQKPVEFVEPMTASSLSANSVFSSGPEDSNVSKSAPTDYSVSQPSTVSQDEPIDPIREADTFLAFGRDVQAENTLLEGLAADPGRHAIHVKLLEIYAGRRSTMQFNTLAQDLRDQTGGSGPEWEQAFAMGQALDPNNPLYQTQTEAPPVVDTEATMVFSAPPSTSAVAEASAPIEVSSGLDFDLGLDGDEAPASAEASKADGVNIDFDLDLDAESTASAAVPAADAAGLDIDFDLDAPSAQSGTPLATLDAGSGMDIDFELNAPPPASAAPTEASVAALVADASDISFDLEMPSVKPEAGAPPEVAIDMALPMVDTPAPSASASDMDFDFDLGTVKLDSSPLAGKLDTPAPLDLGGISLELDSPLAASTAAADDNPDAATKLELALAYEDMGDRDGARELLSEVLNEGGASQKAAAKARLDQLG